LELQGPVVSDRQSAVLAAGDAGRMRLLTESRWLPGRLIQCSPDRDRGAPGKIKIIDLDLSRYDRIASRFQQEQREGVSYLKGGIETRNTAFNRLIDRIEQVAIATRDPLLLMGPTGAGKSRLARRILRTKKGAPRGQR
jgi:transcriptional regulatory protein RtcR